MKGMGECDINKVWDGFVDIVAFNQLKREDGRSVAVPHI